VLSGGGEHLYNRYTGAKPDTFAECNVHNPDFKDKDHAPCDCAPENIGAQNRPNSGSSRETSIAKSARSSRIQPGSYRGRDANRPSNDQPTAFPANYSGSRRPPEHGNAPGRDFSAERGREGNACASDSSMDANILPSLFPSLQKTEGGRSGTIGRLLTKLHIPEIDLDDLLLLAIIFLLLRESDDDDLILILVALFFTGFFDRDKENPSDIDCL